MKRLLIENGRIVRTDGISSGSLLIEDGRIADADYRGEPPEDSERFDARGGYVLPGFIELHAHGGGGYDFVDAVESESGDVFDRIYGVHLSHGVTRLCPTLTASTSEKTLSFLESCEQLKHRRGFAGCHLEGPFLSPLMCGAQNLSNLRIPDERTIDRLCGYAGIIARITAAPELEAVDKLCRRMTSLGVRMSAGHSAADAETLRRAADMGFDQITHLFCSCSQRIKRGGHVYGGIVEEALINNHFSVELIGDGHHVSRENILLTLKCKGADRVSLVSDAMRAAGCESDSGESYLGEILPENRVILEDGVAKLPDRSSFAGSLASGDMMVSALCGDYGLPLPVVSRMMSETPAKMLGSAASCGRLLPGFDADITILDEKYKTTAVISSGTLIYKGEAHE